jgi:hypothetical protein
MCDCLYVQETLAHLAAEVAELSQRALFGLTDDDVTGSLATLTAIAGVLDGLRAALIREAESRSVPAKLGFTSTKVWLRETQRMMPGTARQLVELGDLMAACPAVASALAVGSVSADQARAVGRSVAALADDGIDADVVAAAETLLVAQAGVFGPVALATMGERILTHVAPDLADEALRRKLDAAESRARIDRGLTFAVERDLQRTRVTGFLTAEGAAIVSAALEPFAKPRSAEAGVRDDRTVAQRRADALVEVCRVAPRLPSAVGDPARQERSRLIDMDVADLSGSDMDGMSDVDGMDMSMAGDVPHSSETRPLAATSTRPRLTVTVDYDVLARELSSGLLETGQILTPESVRRLACDADIIPAVLGTSGQVLDLGRAARVWTGPARQAIVIRDRGCVFPGCDRPPAWCDIHHCTYFSDGGRTDRDNAALVCGFHHELIHHAGWQVRVAPDGLPEVIPPRYVDPEQKPVRNLFHRRP